LWLGPEESLKDFLAKKLYRALTFVMGTHQKKEVRVQTKKKKKIKKRG